MFHVKKALFLIFLIPTYVFSQKMGSTTLEVKSLPTLPARDETVESYVANDPQYKNFGDDEKEWFYWTNYSRSNPKRFWDSVVEPIVQLYPNLKNQYSRSLKRDLYASQRLPFVNCNNSLKRVSQSFAQDLADAKSPPSHTSPTGVTFQSRMKLISIKSCAGENISFGLNNPVLMLVLLFIDEGVPEMGHRKALLNPSFTEMGIGISSYPNNQTLVVQDFACDQKG